MSGAGDAIDLWSTETRTALTQQFDPVRQSLLLLDIEVPAPFQELVGHLDLPHTPVYELLLLARTWSGGRATPATVLADGEPVGSQRQ